MAGVVGRVGTRAGKPQHTLTLLCAIQSENADVEIRNNQKTMATGKAVPNAAPRRFGTALSINSNITAPKGAPMGKAAPTLMSNANAPHLTAENRAEPVARDNVTPGDTLGALDIDLNDR